MKENINHYTRRHNPNQISRANISFKLIETKCKNELYKNLKKVSSVLISPFRIRTWDQYFRELLAHSEDIVRHPDVEALGSARKDEVSVGDGVLVGR